MNFDLSIYDATLIPAIIFVLWIIKQAGAPKKLLPIGALILGILSGIVFIGTSPEGIVAGILLAAAAIGFHSGPKNIAQALKQKVEPNDLIGEVIEIPNLEGRYRVNSIGLDGALHVKKVSSNYIES